MPLYPSLLYTAFVVAASPITGILVFAVEAIAPHPPRFGIGETE